MAAHGIFHDLIVFGAAGQDADAGVFVPPPAIPVERLQIEGEDALSLRLGRLLAPN
jgi:hypothetical protein